ncbi:MAG: CAP domain-containing protein [Pseudonocardiaceae bacterium]
MIRGVWERSVALLVPMIIANAGLIIAAPTAAALDETTSASQALTLVNQQRVNAGCAALRVVGKLQAPAERQSRDQAARNRLGHSGANGSTSRSRLGGLGYSRWAENIAQFQSARAAVKFWSTSPGHRASMLNCAFRDTGLSVARSASGRLYWTQTFGG